MGNKRIDKQIEKYQRELIDTHYQEVETMYKKMRGWRHDYRNHIQTMKVLADKGDLESLKEYLNKLDQLMKYTDLVMLDIKHIDENGFDGQLVVYVDGDNKVAMMILQAYTE